MKMVFAYSYCFVIFFSVIVLIIISIFLLSVADEESTIEEQEIMEGEADHKTELVDLAKDGIFLFFFNPTIATKIIQLTQAILDITFMLRTIADI